MNFVGHIEVARLVGFPGSADDRPVPAPFLLGAALPDLAAMGRFRLLGRPDEPEIAAGVDLHHRTDDAFHRHPLFRATSSAASGALDTAGLGRGAARACGHVGVELLLDGHLLTSQPSLRSCVESAIGAAVAGADDLVGLVEPARQDDWRTHLSRLADWPVPDDYHRPEAVARRLQRILSRRPRLSFAADGVEMVAAALAEQAGSVTSGAADLLADLDRELAIVS